MSLFLEVSQSSDPEMLFSSGNMFSFDKVGNVFSHSGLFGTAVSQNNWTYGFISDLTTFTSLCKYELSLKNATGVFCLYFLTFFKTSRSANINLERLTSLILTDHVEAPPPSPHLMLVISSLDLIFLLKDVLIQHEESFEFMNVR